jgi:hypothetical protein
MVFFRWYLAFEYWTIQKQDKFVLLSYGLLSWTLLNLKKYFLFCKKFPRGKLRPVFTGF